MQRLLGVFFLNLLSCGQCSRVQLIEQFLQQRFINTLVLLHCAQEAVDQEVVRTTKALRESFQGSIYHIDVNRHNFHQQLGWHMYCERYKTGIILNLECSRSEEVLNRLSEKAFFNSSFHWLMFGGQNMEQATCVLSKQNINYDTRIMLVFESADPREKRYEFFDVSGTLKRRGGKVIFTSLGFSTPTNLLPAAVAPKPDLQGIKLWAVLTTINQHQPRPFMEHIESNSKPKSYISYAYSYKLVKLLQMKLKFKLKIILADDWRFNLIGKNSSRGMVGQIQSKTVDFSITPYGATTERVYLSDNTIEIDGGNFYTIFRHPKSLNQSNIFLLPFETLLWIALVVILVSVTFALALSSIFNRRLESGTYNDLIIDQSLLGTLGMLCQQGFNASTRVSSKKILIIVTMSFSLMLLQFYSTFIVGYQLITPPKTINTLEKLVDSNLKMSVEDLSYQHDYFERTTNPAALRLYKEKIEPNINGFVNLTFGIHLVKRGGYAFLCDTSYGYSHVIDTFTEQEICELQTVQIYPQRAIQLPMIKGSPIRELFKVNLQLLKEHGLIAYYHSRAYIRKPKCIKNSNKAEQIYLTDVRFAFILLGCGLATSAGMLVLELTYLRLRRWYQFKMLIIPADFVWVN